MNADAPIFIPDISNLLDGLSQKLIANKSNSDNFKTNLKGLISDIMNRVDSLKLQMDSIRQQIEENKVTITKLKNQPNRDEEIQQLKEQNEKLKSQMESFANKIMEINALLKDDQPDYNEIIQSLTNLQQAINNISISLPQQQGGVKKQSRKYKMKGKRRTHKKSKSTKKSTKKYKKSYKQRGGWSIFSSKKRITTSKGKSSKK